MRPVSRSKNTYIWGNTYKRDLQNRPTKQTNKVSFSYGKETNQREQYMCKEACERDLYISKETYKKDLQKRHTKETNKRGKKTYQRDQYMWKKAYERDLYISPMKETYIYQKRPMYMKRPICMKRDIEKNHNNETGITQQEPICLDNTLQKRPATMKRNLHL